MTEALAQQANQAGAEAARLIRSGLPEEAVEPAFQAAQMFQELAEADPAYLPQLSATLYHLSACLAATGDHDEALALCERAIDISCDLLEENPEWRRETAMMLRSLIHRRAQMGDLDGAVAAAEDALACYPEGPNSQRMRAEVLNDLAAAHLEHGDRDAALDAAAESLQVYTELFPSNPVGLVDGWYRAWQNLVDIQGRDRAEADADFEKAISDLSPALKARFYAERAIWLGAPDGIGHLLTGIRLAEEPDDPELVGAARRELSPGATVWAEHLDRASLPEWATLAQDEWISWPVLEEWVCTETLREREDFLNQHWPNPTADDARQVRAAALLHPEYPRLGEMAAMVTRMAAMGGPQALAWYREHQL